MRILVAAAGLLPGCLGGAQAGAAEVGRIERRANVLLVFPPRAGAALERRVARALRLLPER